MEGTHLFPEEPRQCQQSPAPVPPPVIEMVETILEFEEDEEDCSTHSNNQSHHLTSPLHQFQSPGASILLHHLQSPMSCSHPLPPVNTPSTGEGQAALLHSCHQQLVVAQSAANLAAVTGPTQQVTAALASSCSVTAWQVCVGISSWRKRTCTGQLLPSFCFVGGREGRSWAGCSGRRPGRRWCRRWKRGGILLKKISSVDNY